MAGVIVSDLPPESERVVPLPLTKEAITRLNNHSVTFKDAPSLFDVSLPTFKAKLLEFNIFVWKEPSGAKVRIHGGDNEITVFFKLFRKYFCVRATLPFSDVIRYIESALHLSNACYELTYESRTKISVPWPPNPRLSLVTYKQPQTLMLRTDMDWHKAVESSENNVVMLNVKSDAAHIVSALKAYDEEEESSDFDDEY